MMYKTAKMDEFDVNKEHYILGFDRFRGPLDVTTSRLKI